MGIQTLKTKIKFEKDDKGRVWRTEISKSTKNGKLRVSVKLAVLRRVFKFPNTKGEEIQNDA